MTFFFFAAADDEVLVLLLFFPVDDDLILFFFPGEDVVWGNSGKTILLGIGSEAGAILVSVEAGSVFFCVFFGCPL